jgi:hypothetical protein
MPTLLIHRRARRRRWARAVTTAVFGLLAAALLPACKFAPQPISGGITCSAQKRCPEGLACRLTSDFPNGICCGMGDATCGGRLNTKPMTDAAGPTTDAGASGNDAMDDPNSGDGAVPVDNLIKCDPTVVGACSAGQSCQIQCVGTANPGLARSSCGTAGTQQLNQACTLTSDCAAGLRCLAPLGCSGKQYCRSNCKSDADCGGGGSCINVTCSGQNSGFGACLSSCDPVSGSGCGEGLVCTLSPADRTDCQCRTGTGGDGATCTKTADCQSGFMCLQRGAATVCRRICRIGTSECGAGNSCVVIPQNRAFGACVPTATDVPPACDPALANSCTAGSGCEAGCNPATGMQSADCAPKGTKVVAELCTGASDCGPGHICLGTACADGKRLSYCKKHCKVSADCGGGTARCSHTLRCGTAVAGLYGTCSFACDPRGAATSGCPSGAICILLSHEVTDCSCRQASQTGTDGQPCMTNVESCEPGLTCAIENTERVCRPICRLDMPLTCAAGRACRALPDQKIFGACMP